MPNNIADGGIVEGAEHIIPLAAAEFLRQSNTADVYVCVE